ncbi:MAG: PD-(D/E)XK nuclease family protein, partial [Actinobacteria bacterium]|nr:PD-(D/E)XK nuclease family protein [Actinomycetota bacterium]
LEKLMGLVDGFMRSSLWERIEGASKKYFEVPFALEDSEGDGSDGSDGSIVYGVIDLVFEEEDGWVIVDYKTDDFEGDQERKRVYQKQVDMYGKCWERISGERVKERVLFRLS